MDKSKALEQVVKLLTLTASYIQANDPDRTMASLSIIADVMEENQVAPSDVEALIALNNEVVEVEEPSLRSRVEQMVKDVNNIPSGIAA